MTCSQSVVLPLAGIGRALAFGNVNNAPTIASAKKPLRSCCLIFGLFMFFEFSFRCFGLLWLLILRSPFWPSQMYCVKFLDPLRGKVWNFCRGPAFVPQSQDYGGQARISRIRTVGGSRVGCFVTDAGGTPASTAGLLRREGSDDSFEAWIAAK